jgi:hypothetical protein
MPLKSLTLTIIKESIKKSLSNIILPWSLYFLRAAFKEMKIKISDDEINYLIKKYDNKNSGNINYEDFIKAF